MCIHYWFSSCYFHLYRLQKPYFPHLPNRFIVHQELTCAQHPHEPIHRADPSIFSTQYTDMMKEDGDQPKTIISALGRGLKTVSPVHPHQCSKQQMAKNNSPRQDQKIEKRSDNNSGISWGLLWWVWNLLWDGGRSYRTFPVKKTRIGQRIVKNRIKQ